MKLAAGATIGAYEVVELIGRGGMGAVYKGYHVGLDRHVAIKILPEFFAEEEAFRERFHQEAKVIAKLRHPNILNVFDYGQQDGVSYFVSEYLEGGTLESRLGAAMPVRDVIALLRPIASALDYAHEKQIFHRDIKPANILFSADGSPVLADFGLAKLLGSGPMTRTGTVMGTPEYMSPEQCNGAKPSAASDLYSLAVIAYQLLTGRVPFPGDTPGVVILAQISKPAPPPRDINHDLPEEVASALEKGLAKDPAGRFSSATAFVDGLVPAGFEAAPAAYRPPTWLLALAGLSCLVPLYMAVQDLQALVSNGARLSLVGFLTRIVVFPPTLALGVVGLVGVGAFWRRRPWASAWFLIGPLATATVLFTLLSSLFFAITLRTFYHDTGSAILELGPAFVVLLAAVLAGAAVLGIWRRRSWGRLCATAMFGLAAATLVGLPYAAVALRLLWAREEPVAGLPG